MVPKETEWARGKCLGGSEEEKEMGAQEREWSVARRRRGRGRRLNLACDFGSEKRVLGPGDMCGRI